MKKKILLTGGGSAGHVTVNQALMPHLEIAGWNIFYMGSENGIERELMEKEAGLKYYAIPTGKLRRYFDIKNFKDPFRVLAGVGKALKIIRKERPDLVFSKGGFVSVPVVIAASLAGVPVLIHESDVTPGLANKIAGRFAKKIFYTFPDTGRYLDGDKAVYAGAVVREELKTGDPEKGRRLAGFSGDKPVILVMGGSLGSHVLNGAVREALEALLTNFNIIHLCGKGNLDPAIKKNGYLQAEYVTDELKDYYALAEVMISRAGSNSIFESLALKIPMLLVPLSENKSRGDQILNAQSFVKAGYAEMIREEKLTAEMLEDKVRKIYGEREKYIGAMTKAENREPIKEMLGYFEMYRKK